MVVTGKIISPIVIITYNRPYHIKKLLLEINKYKVDKIYIVSDGPKNDLNDIKLVKKTRHFIDKINKNRKIIKIYSDKNLGLRQRIITGLNKVFKKEKEAIILEDDCIPTKEFFLFTKILLKKYRRNKKIVSICGSNHLSEWNETNAEYLVSKYFNSWGWATWADRWNEVNLDPKYLLNKKNDEKIFNHLTTYRALFYWRYKLKKILLKKTSSWAYTYNYYYFLKNKYHIIPKQNLLKNIGFGLNSSNTKILPMKYFVKKNKNKLNINFRQKYSLNDFDNYNNAVEDIVFSKSILNRIKWIFGIKNSL